MQPGDLGWIFQVHGELYVRDGDYEPIFETYVAKGLPPFLQRFDAAKDGLWIAEVGGQRVGAIAIQHDPERPGWAQLRWYFVLPDARGTGLGARLLDAALRFCRDAGYAGIFLWTMSDLAAARHLYERAGFRLVEEADAPWHATHRQQRFEMVL